jgi:nucleoside-diphosphate-sugar epimerase
MTDNNFIINLDDPILITGANGFIGCRVVEKVLEKGFRNVGCFVRPSGNLNELNRIINASGKGKVALIKGNLLSGEDCKKATEGIMVVFHLAAGIEKSFPGCFMNSVIATRNLLDAVIVDGVLRRFVNVSSLAVYSNKETGKNKPLDETCEIDIQSELRYEAYAYGKVKQDELLLEYTKRFNIPYVIVRPGDVYGRGRKKIPGKVGIDTFGVFLHLGGSSKVPLTYVDNCAEAIVLSGITKGIDGEIFNIVDDDLPKSHEYLRMYKKKVRRFRSISVPYPAWYFFCLLWEKYSVWSEGQLPPAFNRRRCIAGWKRMGFSNRKAKEMLKWKQKVSTRDALLDYFEYLKGSPSVK